MSEVSLRAVHGLAKPALDFHRISPEFLENPVSVSEKNYSNRADIIPDVHLESRAGDHPAQFRVETWQPEGQAWPVGALRCTVSEPGNYVRFCLSFSLDGCAPGDLLHLRWLGRPRAGGALPVSARLMVCDGSKNGKKPAMAEPLRFDGDIAWQQRDLLLQLAAAEPGELFHLVFDMPAESSLEVADLRLSRLGRRPLTLGKASTRLKLLKDLTSALPEAGPAEAGEERGVLLRDGLAVQGLAWDAGDPQASVSLELVVDGAVNAILLAEPMTSDLALEDSPPGSFSMTLPHNLSDGAEHSVAVRFAASGTLLGGPLAVRLDTAQEGMLQLGADGQLVGWAVDRNQPGPVAVEILADGAVIAELLAEALHPVLTGPAYNDGRCAFQLPLPPALQDGHLHFVSARIKGGYQLAGGELPVRQVQGRYFLQVDPGRSDRITGWALDRDAPGRPVTLELWLDGRSFGQLRADRPRAELDGQRHGFLFVLPQAAQVELRTAGGEVLAGFAVTADHAGARRWRLQSQAARPAAAEPAAASTLDAFVAAGGKRLFDEAWYLLAYPQAAAELAAGLAVSAFDHWVSQGAALGWSPNAWFNEAWYRREYAVEGKGRPAFDHWLTEGSGAWRWPNPGFDPRGWASAQGIEAENALAAVEAWLDSLARAPEPVPPAPPPSQARTYAALAQARGRKGLLYDSYIQRLLEDIGLADAERARKLSAALTKHETELTQWLLDRPVAEEPLVSIIMPTFNRGFLIAEAIQSVLDQSWKNWELLICDDGSTDKTAFVVKGFDDPRIRFLTLEKSNGAIARNFGMKFSRGRYITFLDSDNLWHPLFIQASVAGLQHSGQAVVYSGYIDTEMKGARLGAAELKFTGFDYQALLRRNYIDLNTICMERAVFDLLGGFNESLGRVQDWDLMLKYGRLVTPLGMPVTTAFYRRNVAWGQVTDLQAHTDFNAIVGQDALDRLASPLSLLPEGRAGLSLTLLGGDTLEGAQAIVSLAGLLEDSASIRLLLPDLPALRSFVARSGLAQATHLLWLAPGDDPRPLLSGEAVVLPEGASDSFVAGLGDIPLLRLVQEGEVALLRPAGTSTGIAIGALQIADVDSLPAETGIAALDTAPAGARIAVLAAEEARYDWAMALAARSRGGDTGLLVSLASDGRYSASLASGGHSQPLEIGEAALLAALRGCRALALAAPSARNRMLCLSLGITALAAEVPVVAVPDPTYQGWLDSRSVFAAQHDDAPRFLARVSQVIADPNGAARVTRRGRRQFEHLHRRKAMEDRLKLAFAVTLGR
ncbi:glycosyltransferase family 2 protein [Roseomonas sp. 18066]|uniref:glycosyltransferase family 2 protein n=1 Tax=Roseomonas sp. 18066 TaxID=2681412 RepID=UPI001359D355|nr:glycosyltransferase family 2 protein [Roseomonas sp. 18066]